MDLRAAGPSETPETLSGLSGERACHQLRNEQIGELGEAHVKCPFNYRENRQKLQGFES